MVFIMAITNARLREWGFVRNYQFIEESRIPSALSKQPLGKIDADGCIVLAQLLYRIQMIRP